MTILNYKSEDLLKKINFSFIHLFYILLCIIITLTQPASYGLLEVILVAYSLMPQSSPGGVKHVGQKSAVS